MRKLTGALLMGAVGLLTACGPQTKTDQAKGSGETGPGTPATDEEKAIYALGAAMGQRAVQPLRLTDKELAVLQKGIADTARGGKPAYELEKFQGALQKLAESRAAAGALEEHERSKAFRDQAAAVPGAVKTQSGLIYRTLVEGHGRSPGPESVVRVHYRGTLTDGTEFDSSIARGQPVEFSMGQVIPCWREGVQRMKVGEKAKLVCPAEIAYGDGGRSPTIVPGATLVFEVELLGIK